MDFRYDKCKWCVLWQEPLEICAVCPKYIKYVKKKDTLLTHNDFCSICINFQNDELKIYCERNRYFQRNPEPDDDFDCYKFCPKR